MSHAGKAIHSWFLPATRYEAGGHVTIDSAVALSTSM